MATKKNPTPPQADPAFEADLLAAEASGGRTRGPRRHLCAPKFNKGFDALDALVRDEP